MSTQINAYQIDNYTAKSEFQILRQNWKGCLGYLRCTCTRPVTMEYAHVI